MTEGDLGSVLATREYDTTCGERPNSINISEGVIAVVYRRTSVGYIRTFAIGTNGSITPISTVSLSPYKGISPRICHLTENLYVIVNKNSTGYGRGELHTLTISSAGIISAVIDTYEFETSDCDDPAICNVAYNMVAIFFKRAVYNLDIVTTVQIESDGSITGIKGRFQQTTYGGRKHYIHRVGETDYYLLACASLGHLATIEIDSDGVVAAALTDSEGVTGLYDITQIAYIGNGIYAISYADTSYDVGIVTVSISDSGNITEIDKWIIDSQSELSRIFPISHIGGGIACVCYSYAAGRAKTFKIASDGTITKNVIDTLIYLGSGTHTHPWLTYCRKATPPSEYDIYAVFYQGNAYDGYMKTFGIAAAVTEELKPPPILARVGVRIVNIGVI